MIDTAERLACRLPREEVSDGMGHAFFIPRCRGEMVGLGDMGELAAQVFDGRRRWLAIFHDARAHSVVISKAAGSCKPIGERRYAEKKESHGGILKKSADSAGRFTKIHEEHVC